MKELISRYIAQVGAGCDPAAGAPNFFGLPPWYKYLPGKRDAFNTCVPVFEWNDLITLWGIGLAVIDMLLRVVALVTIGFIIWGGFQYMTSTGEPDRIKAAKETITNALIGLVIAIGAASIVSYIGNTIK